MSRGRDGQVAKTLADYLFFNRTFDWDAALENKVEAVTAVQATSALRKYIEPSRLTVVAAGSFANAAVAE